MRAWIGIAIVVGCSPAPRLTPDGGGAGDPGAIGDGPVADPCLAAAQQRSYIGCVYWPVDLANAIDVFGPPTNGDCSAFGTSAIMMASVAVCVATDGTFAGQCDPDGTCASGPAGSTCQVQAACALDAQHSPFTIIVANTGTDAADVTLVDASGTSAMRTVAAGQTASFAPQALGFVDRSISAPGITKSSYKLTSTRPIVAYQFNPLDDVGVFSNDASLLLPEQTFDATYIDLSYPNMVRRPGSSDWRGYMTVVATRDTTVTVQAPAATDVLAGTTTIPAGQTHGFALQAFDTLQLVAAQGDISGTRVTGDQPIGAYAGHEAAMIQDPFPFRGPCCADHLEEQLFATTTWGSSFAIARGRVRATQIHDLLRVVAAKPNTVVSVTPPLSWGSTCAGHLLAAGEARDIYIDSDVELQANQPVLAAHFMVSGGGLGPQSGDPSLAFVPPVAQFRKSYTIVVPKQYDANDLELVMPTGGTVTLDGADVSLLLTPFASGTWSSTRIEVMPGSHTIACPMGCSVEVSGWNTAVSYMYSGGLDLTPIVE